MKIPRLLVLAFIIAAVHIVVIAAVMCGSCSSSHPAAGGNRKPGSVSVPPPVIPKDADKAKTEGSTVGKWQQTGHKVTPVIPGDRKRAVPVVPGKHTPGHRRGAELPPIPEEVAGRDSRIPSSGNSTAAFPAAARDPRTLPPPAAPLRFTRSAYRTSYAVKGNISQIPLTGRASSGILLDVSTRNILWMKDPDKAVPIASLTKIMTLLLACEDIASGRVTLQDRVKATPGAWRIREGVVWMAPHEVFTLEELMQAASVKSANDAAYLIAEYLGNGKVENFVKRMNARAAALGMTRTRYYNPHGLPGRKKTPDNCSTARDLLLLSEYVSRIPLFMHFASLRTVGFRKEGTKGHLKLLNHNKLLPKSAYGTPGVDGLKTGYTNKAGFCLALSCVRNGRRLLAVGTGFKVSAERERCMRSLLEWGYLRAADPAAPPEKIVLPGQKRKKAAAPVRRKNKRKK